MYVGFFAIDFIAFCENQCSFNVTKISLKTFKNPKKSDIYMSKEKC